MDIRFEYRSDLLISLSTCSNLITVVFIFCFYYTASLCNCQVLFWDYCKKIKIQVSGASPFAFWFLLLWGILLSPIAWRCVFDEIVWLKSELLNRFFRTISCFFGFRFQFQQIPIIVGEKQLILNHAVFFEFCFSMNLCDFGCHFACVFQQAVLKHFNEWIQALFPVCHCERNLA